MFARAFWLLGLVGATAAAAAEESPYATFPASEAPYYRVIYEPSADGGLPFGVNFTVWVPPKAETLRGVIVHQHGCGVGSCTSGLTGAYDLHWQALAAAHDCALLAPSYRQPDGAKCQLWCDPRNGSGDAFRKALEDLGEASGHPEMADVPWALWGHSGGGHWCGGMTLLYPERVAAVWLRSGVPLLEANPKRTNIKPHILPEAALSVPMMANLGTKEGVTDTTTRFAYAWTAVRAFFDGVRGRGGLIGVAVDPLTSHECGNQRYLAIPWLDACLAARLPDVAGDPLRPMSAVGHWLADPTATTAVAASEFEGDALSAGWLPNAEVAAAWMQYVVDTNVIDKTPPPGVFNVSVEDGVLTWDARADLQSGLAAFSIEDGGEEIGRVPANPRNPYGRPLFQGLLYSDTPTMPLAEMRFPMPAGASADVRVRAWNTAGLVSGDGVGESADDE